MALQIQKNNQTITLRNLQEQVQKNKEDIAKHYEIDRALSNLGIKIVGQVESGSNLPDPLTYPGEYGDAYAVGVRADVEAGISTYVYYVFTRPDPNAGIDTNQWLDVGKISIVGPKGPEGPEGPQGEPGTNNKWYAGLTYPLTANEGDMFLNNNTGNIYQFKNSKWQYMTNSKGPQGIQGEQGVRGLQGVAGVQGPKGPAGDPAGIVNILGVLESTSLLPLPTDINNMKTAYLVGTATPYRLYIQVGSAPANAMWIDAGLFNTPYLDAIELGAGLPSDATEGDITQAQVDLILNNKDRVKILLFGEYYSLADDRQESEDVLIFSHVGLTNAINYVKTIWIALDELRWYIDSTAVGVGETITIFLDTLSPGYYEIQLDEEQTAIFRKYNGRITFRITVDDDGITHTFLGNTQNYIYSEEDKSYSYELFSQAAGNKLYMSIYDDDPEASILLGDLDITYINPTSYVNYINFKYERDTGESAEIWLPPITTTNQDLALYVSQGWTAADVILNVLPREITIPVSGKYKSSSGDEYIMYGFRIADSGVLSMYNHSPKAVYALAQTSIRNYMTITAIQSLPQ